MILAYPPKNYLSALNWPLKIVIFILKKSQKSKNALLEHIKCLNQKTQLVSYIFLDSEQLLTHAYPPKNASKYPKKKFGHPTDFGGLIRALNIFFSIRLKRYNYHKYGIGIYIEFHHML